MPRTIQTNFTAGELSPRVYGRVDTKAHQNGAKNLTNVFVQMQGGARRRPGTIPRYSSITEEPVRIEPWMVRRDLAFIIVITHEKLRILQVSGTTFPLVYEVAAPWSGLTTTDEIYQLSIERQGALVWFSHKNWITQQLQLLTETPTFSLIDFPYAVVRGLSKIPQHNFAKDVTLTLSSYLASANPITVTASADLFDASHVGEVFTYRNTQMTIASVSTATSATANLVDDAYTTLGFEPLRGDNGLALMTVTMVAHGLQVGDTVQIQQSRAGAGWTLAQVNTTFTVTQVKDDDNFVVTVAANATSTEDFGGPNVRVLTGAATTDWTEPAHSDYRGWPQAVAIHQQRLWLGGSAGIGDDRFGSRVGDYWNFDLGEGEDDRAIRALGDTGGFNIRHLVSGVDLEVLGDRIEAFMPTRGIVITPSNKRVVTVPGNHGASFASPIRFDGSTLFVDAVGAHVRELMSTEEDEEVYTSQPVTALNPDIINLPIHSAHYEGSITDATPYVFYTNTDGTVGGFFSYRAEGSAGWFRLTTDGLIKSMAGIGERLFWAARRDDGITYIEELDMDGFYRSDCMQELTSGGGATTAWTAPALFWGKDCDTLDENGAFLGRVVPNAVDGAFLSSDEVASLWLGLAFTFTIETMPPVTGYTDGTKKGLRERIVRAVVNFKETRYARVFGREMILRNAADFFADVSDFTGEKQFRNLGRKRSPTVTITGDVAEPCEVLSILQEVS